MSGSPADTELGDLICTTLAKRGGSTRAYLAGLHWKDLNEINRAVNQLRDAGRVTIVQRAGVDTVELVEDAA